MPKNPGFGTRSSAISAALDVNASDTKKLAVQVSTGAEELIPVGFRLPKGIHDELHRISFESRKLYGRRVPINELIILAVRRLVDQEKGGQLKLQEPDNRGVESR